MHHTFGTLTFTSALDSPELLSASLKSFLEHWSGSTPVENILIAKINPDYSDTEDFCAHYQVAARLTANCLIVEGRRGSTITPAACLVPAHARADINGLIRRALGVRTVSLASKDFAVDASGMEYGSITIVGLPTTWPLLIDESLTRLPYLLIGGSLRTSKLLIPGSTLAELPGARIMSSLVK
jgi:prolyl-tRNA editing enzyme YbaK/EbsC (Cys-tRNA(Pro) deacylase)